MHGVGVNFDAPVLLTIIVSSTESYKVLHSISCEGAYTICNSDINTTFEGQLSVFKNTEGESPPLGSTAAECACTTVLCHCAVGFLTLK